MLRLLPLPIFICIYLFSWWRCKKNIIASYKQPETLFTSLLSVFKGEDHLRFFDHRFIGIWVLPIALTGIVFEILLIAPTNNTSPFN